MHISAAGFSDRIGMVHLPQATSLESSHLMEPGKPFSHAMAAALHEMELRVRIRPFASAIVNADELYRHTGGLRVLLQRVLKVSAKGINPENACVSMDGKELRGRTIESIDPSGISFIEVKDGGTRAPSPSVLRRASKCGPAAIHIWTNR